MPRLPLSFGLFRRSRLDTIVRRPPRRRRRRRLAVQTLDDRAMLSGISPLALNDSFSLPTDGALAIDAPGILANDSDPEGDPLSAELFNGTAHGTLEFQTDGSFSYLPAPGFSGYDSFSYLAFDGTSHSALAAVTLHVVSPTAPALDLDGDDSSALGGDFATTFTEGSSPVAIVDSDASLTDPDSPQLTSLLVTITNLEDGGQETLSANTAGTNIVASYAGGVLTLRGSDSVAAYRQVLGTLVYQNISQNPSTLPRVITLAASDGMHTSNVAVSTVSVVGVNDSPQATSDHYTTSEDTLLVIPAAGGVLANDADVEGAALSAVLVSMPSHGAITLLADGSLNYTPHPNYFGPDSFTYLATDGSTSSNIATVNLSIDPVNDAPIAAADSYNTTQGGMLKVASAGVLANDRDVDGDRLTALVAAGPAHGTLTLSADGSFVYIPEAGYAGSDSFTYEASDGAVTTPATVAIQVAAVNSLPVAANDSFELAEDGILNVLAPALLANDVDGDGDPLSVALVTRPMHGTLTLNADGSFSYTPYANYQGVDGFSYVATDGPGTSDVAAVTLSIQAMNDPPVAMDDQYMTGRNTPLVVAAAGVLEQDADVEGDSLSARLVSPTSHGTLELMPDGSFRYIPDAGFHGSDAFSYVASDGAVESNAATVTIVVASLDPENQAPEATADNNQVPEDGVLAIPAPGVLANDADANGDLLTAVLVTRPLHGVLIFGDDGSFTYTPHADFVGSDSFTYQASDGQLTSTPMTVTLTVTETTDAPGAGDDLLPPWSPAAGSLTIAASQLLANDSPGPAHESGQALSIVDVGGAVHGTAAIVNGSILFTPEPLYQGPASFNYTVTDNGLTGGLADPRQATATVSFEVLPAAASTGWLFDFNGPNALTAPGYIGVGPVNAFRDIGKNYGWNETSAAVDRTAPSDYKLLDGHSGTSNTFLMTNLPAGEYLANVTIGDATRTVDEVQFKIMGAADPLTPMTAPAGQFASAATRVVISSGRLILEIADLGGVDRLFGINSLELRPMESVGQIKLECITAATTLLADGRSIDTFQGSGAPANALLTLTTSIGSFATPDLPLSASPYVGLQVMSDSLGQFRFQLERPAGAGAASTRITATEVTGRALGSLNHVWQPAQASPTTQLSQSALTQAIVASDPIIAGPAAPPALSTSTPLLGKRALASPSFSPDPWQSVGAAIARPDPSAAESLADASTLAGLSVNGPLTAADWIFSLEQWNA
jgi:VCBS repeat-containing protein